MDFVCTVHNYEEITGLELSVDLVLIKVRNEVYSVGLVE